MYTLRVVIGYRFKWSGVVFHFSIITIPKTHSLWCIPKLMLNVKIMCRITNRTCLLFIIYFKCIVPNRITNNKPQHGIIILYNNISNFLLSWCRLIIYFAPIIFVSFPIQHDQTFLRTGKPAYFGPTVGINISSILDRSYTGEILIHYSRRDHDNIFLKKCQFSTLFG